MKYRHVKKMKLFRISQKAFGFTLPAEVMKKFDLKPGLEFDLEAELNDSGLLKITYATSIKKARHEDNVGGRSIISRFLSIFKQSTSR